ncbi:hypothetical protein [Streptomyces sp. NPDC096934]|uniref:hypothetical protein n=1 Tax=Streptomyces sp. NPDC096934 TaxID=3155551 RepID=UPI00332588AB
MPTLEEGLSGLLAAPGVTGAALVDAVTGLVYAAAGDTRTGEDSYDLAVLAGDHLNRAGFEGEVESVIVSTQREHQVVLRLGRQGDPLLLTATVDRSRTSVAWALQDLTQRADALLT